MDPQDIRLAFQIGGYAVGGATIVLGLRYTVRELKQAVNGHVKNGAVHMSVEEKSEIAVVSVKTDSNEEFITVLRSDLEKHESNVRADLKDFRKEAREDLRNGLKQIHEAVKNGG